jgi:hypothetical protein
LSSLTLPSWGCLHGGELSELPTPEPPTVALDSSSLFPTPLSRDHKDAMLLEYRRSDRGGEVQEDSLPRALTALLPTPVADHSRGLAQPGSDYSSLPNAVMDLLPTPTVMDMGANYTPEEWDAWKAKQRAVHANGNGHGASLTQEAISLLPTPTAAGSGSTPEAHLARKPGRTQVTDLTVLIEGGLIGASTPPPSTDGSASSDGPHQPPPSPAATDDHGSALF